MDHKEYARKNYDILLRIEQQKREQLVKEVQGKFSHTRVLNIFEGLVGHNPEWIIHYDCHAPSFESTFMSESVGWQLALVMGSKSFSVTDEDIIPGTGRSVRSAYSLFGISAEILHTSSLRDYYQGGYYEADKLFINKVAVDDESKLDDSISRGLVSPIWVIKLTPEPTYETY